MQTAHSYTVYWYTANRIQLYRIPVHCKQHTVLLHTGTIQIALIYTVYRYSAKHTFIPYIGKYTGRVETAHIYTVHRYTANTTLLYLLPVHFKRLTVTLYTGTLKTA